MGDEPGPGWAWCDEWRQYYNVQEAEALNEAEMQASNDANQLWQQYEDQQNFAVVQHWLDEQISELVYDLEPQPPKCYSAYELRRQRFIVANGRVLLEMAQRELQHVAAGCSNAHLAHLKKECEKAEAEVSEAVRMLELIVKWCEDNNVM